MLDLNISLFFVSPIVSKKNIKFFTAYIDPFVVLLQNLNRILFLFFFHLFGNFLTLYLFIYFIFISISILRYIGQEIQS